MLKNQTSRPSIQKATKLKFSRLCVYKDTILKEKRERWHKSLSQDVYVDEAINVLQDLKMTYKIKNNLATAVKE